MFRTHHPLYRIYYAMKQRCNNPNDCNYKRYGARGISLCKEWNDSYDKFKEWCESNGYAKGLQLDRIENNGNYDPGNCRFVTRKVNSNNQRKTVMVTFKGVTKPVSVWAEELGIKHNTLRSRIQELKMPIEEAMQAKKLYKGFVNR